MGFLPGSAASASRNSRNASLSVSFKNEYPVMMFSIFGVPAKTGHCVQHNSQAGDILNIEAHCAISPTSFIV